MKVFNDLANMLKAAIFTIGIGIIQVFLIPKILNINEYSAFKEFTLYATYLSIFTFGFCDGIYLQYGGINDNDSKYQKILFQMKNFIFMQILIFVPIFIVGLVKNEFNIVALSILGISQNILLLCKQKSKAVGEFELFKKMNNTEAIIKLMAIIVIIFIFNSYNYKLFIWATIMPTLISMIIYLDKGIFKRSEKYSMIDNMLPVFRLGMTALAANMAVNLFYTIDRWFILYSFEYEDFAYYSFATSIITLVFILVNYLSATFYPILCRNKSEDIIMKISIVILIFSAYFQGSYFIIETIINSFLTDYKGSLDITRILYLSLPAMMIVLGLYSNLFKSEKNMKKYLKCITIILLCSGVLNYLSLIMFNSVEYITIATAISYYVWLAYVQRYYQKLRIKEFIYMVCILLIFILTSTINTTVIGISSYYIIVTIVSVGIYFKELKTLIRQFGGDYTNSFKADKLK